MDVQKKKPSNKPRVWRSAFWLNREQAGGDFVVFLKRIDVTGFKSFADHTEIDFSPGITAVVGPNGSGKSNIADAIRWVLGEQSARTLRGSNMQDVIFAGSETRRSINFCEVSLTLDNADHHLPVVFDEVTVTRRVYRSGESEYLINKQGCRLKDIAELFMDSGMGRESYSIVGQGKIDEMLSTRPEDRRGAFEDAAGIVKFKFRKKEAERRLVETEQNILRVDDILDELQKQALPLEREAQRAAKYKAFQEEHRQLDIGLLVLEIESLTDRWKHSEAALLEATSRRNELREMSLKAETHATKLRQELEQRRSIADSLQSQYVSAVELRQQLQGQLDLLKERAANTERALADKRSQVGHTAEELTELLSRKEAESLALGDLIARSEIKSAELEAASHAADPGFKQLLEQEIGRLNEEYIELHQRSARYRNEVKTAEEYFATDKQRNERLGTEKARLIAERNRYAEHLETGRIALSAEETQIGMWSQKLDELADKQQTDAKIEAEYVSLAHHIESEIASLKSRLELLTELESGYDGYALGAKTVLQAKDRGRLQGIHGALASLIQVQKSYETAVETALGGALQNIVVQTEADARNAIDMLKQRHAGRATFLPLSVIKPRTLREDERQKIAMRQGVLGVASDIVGCDATYRPVLEHLLGNVVVTETLKDANAIASLLGYRYRIVSLEGDVVSPGGAMTGGTTSRKGPGLLGRTRERQDVENRISAKGAERNVLREKQSNLRQNLESLALKQREFVQRIEASRNERNRIQSELNEATSRLEAVAERLETTEWEISELSEGRSVWESRVSAANESLKQTDIEIGAVEEAIANQRRSLQERERSLSDTQALLTTLRVEVATIEQERNSRLAQLTELTSRVERLSLRQHQDEQAASALVSTLTETALQQEGTETKLNEVALSVANLEADTGALRLQLQEAESTAVQAEQDVRRRQQAVTAAEEQVHRAEIQVERTDVELTHALDRMGETHRMTYEWAREHHALTTDAQVAKHRADILKREMSSMGEVHVGAIEEWQRLSERLQFLLRERDDLATAKGQVESVITEIEEEMSKRFLETFEQIRAEFQVSFRQLFGGGRADLSLTNPADPLSTGVEVIAEPPGKKLQNLNLLSGGERAIIAMALLFAILKVRPVPFCVLDEVEAALDEANVARFAQQLHGFSGDTQFIVITHRRGTMEEADVLYGVTMQESGVSSLLGVRLEDADVDVETA